MGERSFAEDVKQLGYGAGDLLHGEGILAITKALLQSGVAYVGGYQGAPISHLMDVLADAEDGGWWALGLADPSFGRHLIGVPMSTPGTGRATREAFEAAGLRVGHGPVLRDVDHAEDAAAVAGACADGSAFAERWGRVGV